MTTITIELPDDLLADADDLADRLGMSRSDLCVAALAEFVARHAVTTARLNALYAVEDSSLDPALLRIQRASLGGRG